VHLLPWASGCNESVGLQYTLSDDGTYYSVTGIGTCTDTDIIIPKEYNGLPVKKIGNDAFIDCFSLTSIVISDSVTSIGDEAFCNCYSLTNVTIPDSVTSIGSSAFYFCTSLTSIEISDSVTSIGNSAFYYCSSLTSVTIGNSVTSISDCAFYECRSLTSINISDSVTSIGGTAFANCSSLKSITIPNSVTTIGVDAFAACSLLTIYCEADSKPSSWHGGWNSTNCPVVWGFAGNFVAVNDKLGDISTALDSIITQTNSIIGGNS
jgi:putative transposon-encoded protein